MKAIYVPEPHKIEIVDVPKPVPWAGEILVKVMTAGICGSDVHIYHGTNALAKYPRIIGHEFAGEIAEIGKCAEGFAIGDHVSVDPVVSCGKCYPCRIGRHNVCTRLEVFGVHRNGGMAEFVAVPAKNAHKIPAEWTWEKAAMVEPFSIAANALSRSCCGAGEAVLVIGAGPIGLTMVQGAAGIGAKVAVSDIIDSRLELAARMGAKLTVNSKKRDIEEAMMEWTNSEGVPLIIDAACIPEMFPQLLRMASPAGRVVNLGFSTSAAEMPQFDVTRKEISIIGSRLNNNMFPKVIEWFKNGTVSPERIISHKFNFQQIGEALKLIEDRPLETCKVVLSFI